MAIPLMRKAIKKSDLIYASGTDMALLSNIAGIGLGRPVVVEIGDIREIQVDPGLIGSLFRWVDKLLINRCKLLVVTSAAFIDNYYQKILKRNIPSLVIENKLEASFLEKEGRNNILKVDEDIDFTNKRIRIGYFGLLRDEWSWKVLKSLALSNPDKLEIVFAGYTMIDVDLEKEAGKHANIFFKGEYKSPQDLPALYNNIDLVWACYPPIRSNDMNLKWARPNRFYQSCFFKKPIVTRFGCQDAIDVEHYKIGLIIKEENIDNVVKEVSRIQWKDLILWHQNMLKVPESVFVYSTEKNDLATALKNILNKK